MKEMPQEEDNELSDIFDKTRVVINGVLKPLGDYLRGSFVVMHLDCAKYLTDEEFETLQGLVRKVQLLKSKDRTKNAGNHRG